MSRIETANADKEGETYTPQMINIFALSQKEQSDLTIALSNTKAKGTMHVWVHSHFMEEDKKKLQELEDKSIWERWLVYERRRAFLLQRRNQRGLPTFVFIESNPDTSEQEQINKYAQYFSTEDLQQIPLYYIVTGKERPGTPSICLSREPFTEAEETQRWDNLVGVLKEMGVKRTIISGQEYTHLSPAPFEEWKEFLGSEELTYIRRNPEKSFLANNLLSIPDQCVGNVLIRFANRDLQSTLSRVSFPKIKAAVAH